MNVAVKVFLLDLSSVFNLEMLGELREKPESNPSASFPCLDNGTDFMSTMLLCAGFFPYHLCYLMASAKTYPDWRNISTEDQDVREEC